MVYVSNRRYLSHHVDLIDKGYKRLKALYICETNDIDVKISKQFENCILNN